MPAEESPSIVRWISGEFSSNIAAALSGMIGEEAQTAVEAAASPPAAGPALALWKQTFSAIGGAVWVAAAEESWKAAGGAVLAAAGIESSEPAGVRSTYQEVLQQGLSGMARAITARLGREVTCAEGSEPDAAAGVEAWFKIEIRATQPFTLSFGVEATLIESLHSPRPAAASPPAVLPARGSLAPDPPMPGAQTLDVLLDVELPVRVSFGRAQVPLRNVLKLTTGSIVELNRGISEPVEVIVNNCVIARGEVVVIDGNFGVRVQEVISRHERLQTVNTQR